MFAKNKKKNTETSTDTYIKTASHSMTLTLWFIRSPVFRNNINLSCLLLLHWDIKYVIDLQPININISTGTISKLQVIPQCSLVFCDNTNLPLLAVAML